jgi:hypothetical protein
MSQTEDVPYEIDSFAIEEDNTATEPDELDQTVNDAAFKEIETYLSEAIGEHNSFDIIDLTEQAKMTPTQQIAVHKCVVQHLRAIKSMIDEKRKEN